MADIAACLSHESVVLVLAYASVGLGHLRVTDALLDGLPAAVNPVLLRASDQTATELHRLSSIHPRMRSFMEWSQHGSAEQLFTSLYRRRLRSRPHLLEAQIEGMLAARPTAPKTLLFISTHFGLAHQMASLAARIEKRYDINVRIVVSVTDDSPQHLWYVEGASLIVVPSERTKRTLVEYAQCNRLTPVPISVVPYPMNPELSRQFTRHEYALRKAQADAGNQTKIRISLPVSGAAVGLTYSFDILARLSSRSPRFSFNVTSRNSTFTESFLSAARKIKHTKVYASAHDREVVDLYDSVFSKQVIGYEITKPSEQAFKALLSPRQRGGVILLFTDPVGRQEYDNLYFLARHGMIPTNSETDEIWERGITGAPAPHGWDIPQSAIHWRGLRLPNTPEDATRVIEWCLHNGVFAAMMSSHARPHTDDRHAHELGDNGVSQFWKLVAELC